MDLEDPGNLSAVRTTYIAQSAPDILKKLQRLLTPAAQPLETCLPGLLSTTRRGRAEGRNKNEEEGQLTGRCHSVPMAQSAAWPASQGGGAKEGDPLDRDQCARCGSFGHWAKDCHNREDPRWDFPSQSPEPQPAPAWNSWDRLQPNIGGPSQPRGDRQQCTNHSFPIAQVCLIPSSPCSDGRSGGGRGGLTLLQM